MKLQEVVIGSGRWRLEAWLVVLPSQKPKEQLPLTWPALSAGPSLHKCPSPTSCWE